MSGNKPDESLPRPLLQNGAAAEAETAATSDSGAMPGVSVASANNAQIPDQSMGDLVSSSSSSISSPSSSKRSKLLDDQAEHSSGNPSPSIGSSGEGGGDGDGGNSVSLSSGMENSSSAINGDGGGDGVGGGSGHDDDGGNSSDSDDVESSSYKSTSGFESEPEVEVVLADQIAGNNNAAAEDEDDETCSAHPCLQPGVAAPNSPVEWIQCERCDKWYHNVCVGVRRGENLGSYMCPVCADRRNEKSSGFEDQAGGNHGAPAMI